MSFVPWWLGTWLPTLVVDTRGFEPQVDCHRPSPSLSSLWRGFLTSFETKTDFQLKGGVYQTMKGWIFYLLISPAQWPFCAAFRGPLDWSVSCSVSLKMFYHRYPMQGKYVGLIKKEKCNSISVSSILFTEWTWLSVCNPWTAFNFTSCKLIRNIKYEIKYTLPTIVIFVFNHIFLNMTENWNSTFSFNAEIVLSASDCSASLSISWTSKACSLTHEGL